MATDGDWRKGCIYKTITHVKSNRKQGVRKWLTEKQLLDYFTPEQVRVIVLRKEVDPELSLSETREHPELKGSGSSAD